MSNIADRLTAKQKEAVSYIYQECIKAGITNLDMIAGLVAVANKETGLIPVSERPYTNSSNSYIKSIFTAKGYPKLHALTDQQLTDLKKNPEKFFNFLYDNKNGNGVNEGYKYRGRGFNQITFKGNYKGISDKFGVDYLSNPELINEPLGAGRGLIWYFTDNNRFFKPNEVTDVQDAVKKIYRHNAGWGNGWPTASRKGYTQMVSEAPQFREYLEKLSKQPINNKKTNLPKFLLWGLLILGGYIVYKNLNKQPNVENLPLPM